MKRIGCIITVLILSLSAFGQQAVTESVIKEKTDSILKEANRLYRYESAAWITTDMALTDNDIRNDFGGYLVYSQGDTVKTIVRSKKNSRRIFAVSFTSNVQKPVLIEKTDRDLTAFEQKLWTVKDNLTNEVFTSTYQIGIPDGFNPVMELIPYEKGYKLYILMGTTQRDIIPLGNDYVFFANADGKIYDWRKFHSRLLSTQSSINGQKVVGITHSHLPSEPYISATDICTFKLYGSIYGLKNMIVFSTALSGYFDYNLNTDSISWKTVEK